MDHRADTSVHAGVRLEEWLSEEGFWPAPARGLARLLEIAAGAGTALVSSQGGAIPGLVSTLAARDGVELAVARDGSLPSKKGSVWVLSFHRPTANGTLRLAAADYYPTALAAPAAARAPARKALAGQEP